MVYGLTVYLAHGGAGPYGMLLRATISTASLGEGDGGDEHHPKRKEKQLKEKPYPSGRNLQLRRELELELIQSQMAQKPMLRGEVGARVRCAVWSETREEVSSNAVV